MEHSRRKELAAQYKQSRPEAAVYRIVNRENGRALLGSSPNLASVRGKLAFARTMYFGRALASADISRLSSWLPGRASMHAYRRLAEDIQTYGIDALFLEVLEVLETKPEMPQARILADLAALEELWREKIGSAGSYDDGD